MQCASCGFRLFKDSLAAGPSARDPVPSAPPRPRQRRSPKQLSAPAKRPPIPIDLPGGMDLSYIPADSDFERVRVRGRCYDAMHALARGDRAAARRALRAALDLSPEFDQPWLFLAALAEDADEQRECLEHVLACDPANPIAQQALLRLEGRLEAETTDRRPTRRLEPGQVAGERLACPQCGGRLSYDEAARVVACHFCGYHVLDASRLPRSGAQSTLIEGILRRKQQGTGWNIGGRWFRCTECGAITTLSRHTMTSSCRFCHSRHVLQEGSRLILEQPDLIVPFTVGEDAAREAIAHRLRGGLRWLTRFFTDAIARVELHGVYLPFWVFDADMTVHWSWSNAPDRGEHPVLLSDVLHPASRTLPRRLVEQIEPYDLRRGVDYDPRLLAVHPAELYSVDVVRASLDVRSRLSRLARRQAETGLRVRRPSRDYGGDDDPGSLHMHTSAQFLTYRLALLPVWLARLVEEDGDTRQALVNGQIGKVALARSANQSS